MKRITGLFFLELLFLIKTSRWLGQGEDNKTTGMTKMVFLVKRWQLVTKVVIVLKNGKFWLYIFVSNLTYGTNEQ